MATSSVFANLRSESPTWADLKQNLQSMQLSVYEVPDSKLAMIRYVRDSRTGVASATLAPFRSVVWNTETNLPVSVSAFKSHIGEATLSELPNADLVIEEFVDGVMIGQFFDPTTQTWRIHTRSTLDAKCRYYSKTKTFAELFQEGVQASVGPLAGPLEDMLDKTVSYTWILEHPENRVVVEVDQPHITLVQATRISESGEITIVENTGSPILEGLRPRVLYKQEGAVGSLDIVPFFNILGRPVIGSTAGRGKIPADRKSVENMIVDMYPTPVAKHQGLVLKCPSVDPFRRWKIRTPSYNRVRKLRGNTARRDFLWMTLRNEGKLEEYLKHYSNEVSEAMLYVGRWKEITNIVYKLYVEHFKARTGDRTTIPNKFRPLVYGLHNHYLTALKPVRRSLDWSETVRWMNARDAAQKVYVLNWDLRQGASAISATPIEPLSTQGSIAMPVEAEVAAAV